MYDDDSPHGLAIYEQFNGFSLFLVLLVISFVAVGGRARATTDLATGHPSSLSRAWRAAVHLFWRFVGLWPLLAILVICGLCVSITVTFARADLELRGRATD